MTGPVTGAVGVLAFLYIFRVTVTNLFDGTRKREWLVLLLVALPIIRLGFFRALYPDQNFDTLHFELYLQDYDLSDNKVNFAAAAIRTYYFPLPERIFGWCRHLLGYRLGTLIDTFLIVAIIASAYDFLKRFFATWSPGIKTPVVLTGLLALFAVWADNALFNIGSYKPDLIGVPILMELMHIVFFDKRERKTSGHLAFFGLVSLVIAYKLTYLPYAALLAVVYFFRYAPRYRPQEWIGYPLLVLVVPSIYLVYNYMETGSPIFPFYNKLFHSSLYPNANFKDLAYGPLNLRETFFFPIVTWLDPGRCNPWHLFSYRLLAGYIIAPLTMVWCVLKRKTDPIARPLFFLALTAFVFDFSCIVTTGYYRYGIIVEVLYGLVLGVLFLRFRKKWVGILILVVILLQSYDTWRNIFVEQKNLSWYEYAALEKDDAGKARNRALLFKDYDRVRDPDTVLSRVNAFVDVGPCPQDGLARLLNKHVPIYDLLDYSRTPDIMARFERDSVRGPSLNRNFETVTNGYNLNVTFAQLSAQGYLVTEVHQVYPSFARAEEPVFLLRIRYLDTSRYTIRYTWVDMRSDAPPGERRTFAYPDTLRAGSDTLQTGSDTLRASSATLGASSDKLRPGSGALRASPGALRAWVMESYYTFDWPASDKAGEISVNGHTFALRDAETENRVYPVTDDHLRVEKSMDMPLTLIIQEIKEKK